MSPRPSAMNPASTIAGRNIGAIRPLLAEEMVRRRRTHPPPESWHSSSPGPRQFGLDLAGEERQRPTRPPLTHRRLQ